MEFGIVILNYLNYQDTLELIDSLDKQNIKKETTIPIVIVDNASNNDSIKMISERIYNKKNYYLLEAQENLGFAKGNNLGIHFLRKKLNIDNILLCNNDLLFKDDNYLTYLSELKLEKIIGVMGTKIIGIDNLNQNPANWYHDKETIEQNVKNFEKINQKSLTYKLKLKIKKTKIGKTILKIKQYRNKKYEDLSLQYSCSDYTKNNHLLHGACIMLTENYFNFYDGLYPGTFLYGEETILDILTKKAHLKQYFIPEITVHHKEDQSSEMSFSNETTVKGKFQYESNKLTLELIEKNLEEIQNDFKHYNGGEYYQQYKVIKK